MGIITHYGLIANYTNENSELKKKIRISQFVNSQFIMDRNLALEFVRVTEKAAIAAARWVGRGDKHKADQAAVDAMRTSLSGISFNGRVVIGEGAKDEAPELYQHEELGKGVGPEIDVAVDPLEATDSVAHGRSNALSIIAAGSRGNLLEAPDTYMDKLAVGPNARQSISLDATPEDNILAVSKALHKPIEDITVIVLDRSRHEELVKKIRSTGARVMLITDGDVAAAIAPCLPDSGIDMLMGIGASAEAVLAAVAVKIMGGQLLSRFTPKTKNDEDAPKGLDFKRIYTVEDLAKGKSIMFTATGVLDGPLLPGVLFKGNEIITHSMVIRGDSGTLRYITAHHRADIG